MDTETFEPQKLDLVMRDADFVIYYGQLPLTTKGGFEIAHPDSRLLKHLLIKLALSGHADRQSVNSYSIFAFHRDFLEQNSDPVNERIEAEIINDPLLKARFGPGHHNRIFDLKQVLEYLEEDDQIMNMMFLGASVIMKGFRELLSNMDPSGTIENDFAGHQQEVVQFIRGLYTALPPEKRAALSLLSSGHQTGIVLPMMLVTSKISPSEYALATLAVHTNFLGDKASESTAAVVGEFGLQPVLVDWSNVEASFGAFHKQALEVQEFLGFFDGPGKKMSVIAELINQGENDQLEYKSTVRWDLRQNKKNPAIEHAALKTLTAFLNSEGGDLLIGVADDGSLVGIESDNFLNDDKFLLHVWALIKNSLGQDVSPYIKTTLEKFDKKTVCRVHCQRSPKPVFLRQSGFDEMFYIRIGPSSGSMEISEAVKFIGEHFR